MVKMLNRDYPDYQDCRDFIINQANPANHENHGSKMYLDCQEYITI